LSSEEKLAGLQFVIGGDDDKSFTERFMQTKGFKSKEIIYLNKNNKGLMIYLGDETIVLGLFTENRKDLDSIIAKQFFPSFHLSSVRSNWS
jgi:hypothetical protein